MGTVFIQGFTTVGKMVIHKVTIHAWARYCDHSVELIQAS